MEETSACETPLDAEEEILLPLVIRLISNTIQKQGLGVFKILKWS